MDILKDIWDLMIIEDIKKYSAKLYIEKVNTGCGRYRQLYYKGLSYNVIFKNILKMIVHNSLTMNMKIELKKDRKEILDIVI